MPDGELSHFDTPFIVDRQIEMFKQAGFSSAEMVFRVGNNTIIVAKK